MPTRDLLDRANRDGEKLDRPRTKSPAARAQAQVEKHTGEVDSAAKDLAASRANLYFRLKLAPPSQKGGVIFTLTDLRVESDSDEQVFIRPGD